MPLFHVKQAERHPADKRQRSPIWEALVARDAAL
jgi:hypothetical protein